MAAGRPTIIPSDPLVSSDEVRHKGFATAFRGFDTNEVRTFLARVADELRASRDRQQELERRLAEAENRAANPTLDESTLLGALGEETARIVRSAHEVAADLRAKAEENVERLLREANEEAARIRGEAEGLLATRTDEADAAAGQIREAAQVWGDEVRAKAREEADNIIEESKRHGRQMVEEAQALRVKILGDLTRRRRVALVQVEQLRAGRERLLEAYRMVRNTLDEVTEELSRAEAEARVAAEVAGHKAAEEAEPSQDELEVAASIAASLGASEPVHVLVGDESDADQADDSPTVAATEPAEPVATEPTPAEPASAEAPAATTKAPAPKPSIDPGSHDERRLSSLRILRRPKVEEPAAAEPAATTETVTATTHEPVEGEGVRLIRPQPDSEPAASEMTGDTASAVTDEVAGDDATEVDALFARIRASREAQVAEAQEVLAAAKADGPEDLAAEAAAPEGAATATSVPADEPDEGEPAIANADELILQRRDALVDGVTHSLARKLKRALQDDQNDLLDRLRTNRGKVSEDLLGHLEEHAGRFRVAAYDLLADAARAGTVFAAGGEEGGSGPSGAEVPLPAIADVADELAQGITRPLRSRLDQALADAVSENDDEQAVIERIGAAYREWKTQRIERLATDHIVAAFSRGAFAATAEATPLRWVVDDVDGPCPDCDDNALAGPTVRGQAFPTGQTHPPAHPGCRCVLVPTPA